MTSPPDPSPHGQRPPTAAPPPAHGVPTRYLSGIQPSGELHLGNYFGAIQQHITLQETAGGADHAFYFIANYHSLTTVHDADQLRALTLGVALDYLALGLDPAKATLFRQTDVPEVCELAWVLSCVVNKGLLERATSYKDKVARGIDPSMGLFNYPILMAADILIYRGTIVPVGKDQQQHVEFAQDMAEAFNHKLSPKKPVLVPPTWRFNPAAAVVPGIDGEKMSKSYKNTIPIFAPTTMTAKQVWKTYFAPIKTDSRDVADPKDPDATVMALYRLVDPQGAKAFEPEFLAGGIGYGVVKQKLHEAYTARFGPLAEKRAQLAADPTYVEDVLATGARRARAVAREVMAQVREACGLVAAAGTHP